MPSGERGSSGPPGAITSLVDQTAVPGRALFSARDAG